MPSFEDRLKTVLVRDLNSPNVVRIYETVAETCKVSETEAWLPIPWLKKRFVLVDPTLSTQTSAFNRNLASAVTAVMDCKGKIDSAQPVPNGMRQKVALTLGHKIRGCFGALILQRRNDCWIRPVVHQPSVPPGIPAVDVASLRLALRQKTEENTALGITVSNLQTQNSELASALVYTQQRYDELIDDTWQLQIEVAEGREQAPEIQRSLVELQRSKISAEVALEDCRKQLQSYDKVLCDKDREIELLKNKRRKTSATDVLTSRAKHWLALEEQLQSQISELEAFQKSVEEQGLICDSCQVQVKRHKLKCGHGLCQICCSHEQVNKCPLCRASKNILFSMA